MQALKNCESIGKGLNFLIFFLNFGLICDVVRIYLKGTVSKSGTGPLDYGATGPVQDPEPRLGGLSRGPVVCETTTQQV